LFVLAGGGMALALGLAASEPEAARGADAAHASGTFHTVLPGENLWGIARRYGVTVEEIVRVNDLPDAARVASGERLVIPTPTEEPPDLPPVSLPGPLLEEGLKLPRVDEARSDAAFERFREQLLEAARSRDKSFLLGVLDPDVVSDFGTQGTGREAFLESWNSANRGGRLWNELIRTLALGGTFRGSGVQRLFCAPYVYTTFPPTLDPARYAAIAGEKVRMRAGPDPDAEILRELSYDVVRVLGSANANRGSERWSRIRLASGTEGYVSARWVRGPNDFHVCFRETPLGWTMWLLSAGH
jgi:LysM repeat protein